MAKYNVLFPESLNFRGKKIPKYQAPIVVSDASVFTDRQAEGLQNVNKRAFDMIKFVASAQATATATKSEVTDPLLYYHLNVSSETRGVKI
ncbi:hypothetical protein NPIL_334841 [Nephila pilipes]|uniref:Uncharacterized protein n=1 Tax=Nephila pilipes TaxID=299642 RepID=A0A8X6NIE0_NEPPI|nr:hypothetical protein NPIL_334841 [Nephila pilipes]